MPVFRDEVRNIARYQPGRPIEEVAREFGFDPSEIVKLASNESPLPPVRSAIAAMAEEISTTHRYPDNECHDLRVLLADQLGVDHSNLWFGGGSSELLRVAATAVGGAATNAVYAWPSFVIYRLGTAVAGAEAREIPLDGSHGHDLDAMADAVDEHTSILYLCNPNNPTGTILSADTVERFIDRIPERVMVIVDEAYFEYVTDESYATAIPLTMQHPNVIVTRTFSKVYGLAALRVGYGVGNSDTIAELRKAQAPFTVTSAGQVGAVASLRADDEIRERLVMNAAERTRLESVFSQRGLEFVPSQANFVYLRLGGSAAVTTEAFIRHGVILRPFESGWVRVSVGTPDENDRFLVAMDDYLT